MKKTRKKTGISAWLITWENIGDHAKPPERVAAVLSPRLSAQKVLDIVELLYANASYDPAERIAIVRARKNNPYPARFGRYQGEIMCGHNPWLEARLVTNLRAEADAARTETFAWDERPKPAIRLPRGAS